MRRVYTPGKPARSLGYHHRPLVRFVLLAVFSCVLVLGLGSLAADWIDGGSFGPRLDGKFVLGVWVLEALALSALFLLIQGRGGRWWLDGLLAAWIAWIFRGPVLVLSVAEVLGRHSERWRELSVQWLVLYSLCGLLLALLARRSGVGRSGVER